MKKLVLYIVSLLILVSCATLPLEITENDDKLRMIGGKEALLDAIEYPDFALRKGIEGVVTVLAYVDTAGMVRECKIIEGNDYLNDAAVDALMKQRFHPYILEGEKRPVRVAIPISFTISKDINVYEFEADRVKSFADQYLNAEIKTLDQVPAERSPGSKNAYYSEGLTWWPNPDRPNGPYMIKEGEENPDAFRDHAELLNDLGEIVPGLTAAYLITGKNIYAEKAADHIRAWFVDPETRMEPHFKYAQAIPNRTQGRSVGIYEALALVEVIRSLEYLGPFLHEDERAVVDRWLKDYQDFLDYDDLSKSLHPRKDIYSLVWLLQMTAVSRHLDDSESLDRCRYYFEQHTMPFITDKASLFFNPDVNRRDEYNIFAVTDMLALVTDLMSDDEHPIWEPVYYNMKRVGDVINYIYSGILNYDLQHTGNYDGRFLSLLIAGKAYENSRYLEMWRDLNSVEYEKTSFPIREAVLWTK